jgi:DNA-binding response OmpR family regulator
MDGQDPISPGLLVVEDDGAVRRSLVRALSLHGFVVRAVPDGLEALREIDRAVPDLIVLDVGLPGPDGLRLAQRLRSDGHATPILMLTARSEIDARVAGLESGADDYLTKPFALEELVARIRALLRRSDATGTMAASAAAAAPGPGRRGLARDVLRCGAVTLDVEAHTVRNGRAEVDLTPTEFQLLELLLRRPGRVCSRDLLADELWGPGSDGPGTVSRNALEQHVTGLRHKLEADGSPRIIRTVRGVGYVARAPEGTS